MVVKRKKVFGLTASLTLLDEQLFDLVLCEPIIVSVETPI